MTTRSNARALFAVALFAFGCSRNLELPPLPGPPSPGTLQGRLVIAKPGTSTRVPAAKAVVQLLASSAGVVADDDGNFLIEGITKEAGTVLLRFDGDGDGQFEKQKSLSLQALKAGPGRNINLGEVLLGENAQLRGKAVRSDLATPSGHAGSVVFVPESSFVSLTADDGSFLLQELPEGELRLGVYRQNYETVGLDTINLSSGQELTLKTLTLTAAPGSQATPGELKGKVVLLEAGDVTTASVSLRTLAGQSTPTTLSAEGVFEFSNIVAGLYELTVSKDTFRTARIGNLLINAGETTDVGDVALAVGTDLPTSQPDGGSLSDGGTVITGSSPIAVVSLNSVAAVDDEVTLDASRSTDPAGTMLVYHWTQVPVMGEPLVVLSANHSLLASTPNFTAPAAPVQLHFTLTVTNAFGFTSAPVSTVVEILEPPYADVTPGHVLMPPRAVVLLDGSASGDDTGSPLVKYTWAITQGIGQLMFEPLPNSTLDGPKVNLLAPSIEMAGEVTLVVSNGLLTSDPHIIPILVQNSPDGGSFMTVNVTPVQNVTFGTTVSLSAMVTGIPQGATPVYSWMETSSSGVTLVGADTPNAGFAAPLTEQQLTFSFHVNLQGLDDNAFAQTTINIIDDVPPVLVNSEPPENTGALASPFSVWAEFDEALDPTSVTTAQAMIRDTQVAVPADVTWDAVSKRVSVIPHTPLSVGKAYDLFLTGLTDASSKKNGFATKTLAFTAQAPKFVTFSSGNNSTLEPRPAIAATPERIWLFGRIQSGQCGAGVGEPWIHYLDHKFVTGPTQLADFFPQLGNCINTPVTQRRAAATGNDAHALLSYASPLSVYVDSGFLDTYDNVTTPIGALVSDGSALGSPFISGTGANAELHWRTAVNNTWVGGPSAPVDISVPYLVGPEGAGGAMNGPRRLATGLVAMNNSLRIFESVNNGAWVSLSETTPTANVAAVRSAYAGTTPVVCLAHDVAGNRTLTCLVRSATGWSSYTDVAQSVPADGFEVTTRGRTVWVAYSVAGQLRIKMLDLNSTTPAFVIVNGASAASSWNDNATCTANRPEMIARSEGLWVTWQERCPPGNWRVMLTKMH